MALSVCILLFILAATVSLPLKSCSSYEIGTFVDNQITLENGIDCIFGGREHPCHTLKYAAEQLAEHASTDYAASVVIYIIGPTVPLNDTIRFANVRNVWLIGEGTQILCGANEAGFEFSFVNGIHIENLTLNECGTDNLTAAIHINNCINVTVQNVAIASSSGVALAFFDTYGDIQILNTWFQNNSIHWYKKQWHIGAVYIEFSYSPSERCHHLGHCVRSNYNFSNCKFVNNSFALPTAYHGTISNSLGGGLALFFKGSSCFNNVILLECEFEGNYAYWGGGLYTRFANQACNNSVTILRNRFTNNVAINAGGGNVVYRNLSYASPFQNRIFFQGTEFIGNRAFYGGGTAVYASHGSVPSKPGDTITFDNCYWRQNSAHFSSSVDISPVKHDTLSSGFLPVPVFINCNFSYNNLSPRTTANNTIYTTQGAFTVTKSTVQFGHRILFTNHNSSLHVVSGIIEFQMGTQALFYNNSGINGGAIALHGFSSLHVRNGCYLRFHNNTALEVGGAIYYHSFDQHDFVSTHSCFIRYIGPTIDESCTAVPNVTFEFKDNNASSGGNSIYALSLRPCYYELFRGSRAEHDYNLLDGLRCRANFTFDKPFKTAIATAGMRFKLNGSQSLFVIPGQKYNVPLSIMDEMNNEARDAVYRMNTKKLKVEHMFTVTGDIQLYGEPGQKDNIQFSVVSLRDISFQVQVCLLKCPPGFFLSKDKCECSAFSVKHAYPGIEKCKYPEFQAYIVQGYWVGYLDNETSDYLYTAPCFFGFCSYEHNINKLRLLPEKASSTVLSEFICGKYRKGVLCRECHDGRSVYYHSQRYKCGENNNCHFGLLFYCLSEFIPLIILFTTIVVFDVRFTSGTINGFILFSQVLDSMSIDANGFIQLPSAVNKLSIGYKILYGLLNFEFFNIESLSFCLWKQATVLDILAFKYITTIFAFGLVMCLVFITHYCQCKNLCVLKKKFSARDSVIHGLSTFLVMCYAQCTKISFQILTSVTLTGQGGTPGPRVSEFGGIPYFQGKHLLYAIPACICLTIIVAIPPVLLLAFPLSLQLLSLCGLSESRAANWISLHIWTLRLKPVSDSFQACFKDKLRFFAGLYFVYRVIILALFAFSKTTIQYHFTVEAVLLLMLAFHTLAHPYENQQHNRVSSLMFINLALINGLTTFSYVHHLTSEEKRTTDIIAWLQMVLIYLPMVYICSCIVAAIIKRKKNRATEQQLREGLLQLDSLIDHERLPYQGFEESALQHSHK